MDNSVRTSGYDLFKLIVAIILLILFLFLFWRQAPQTAIPQPEALTSTPPPTTGTLLSNPSTSLSTSPTAESAISSPQATLTSSTPSDAASSTPTGTMPSNPSATL